MSKPEKVVPIEKPLDRPSAPAEWPLSKIEAALSRKLPEAYLRHIEKKNNRTGSVTRIPFIPWPTANQILCKYAPGWTWEIKSCEVVGVAVVVIGKLTIPASDGAVSREATGYEELDESGYGNAANNAEASAFKRCAAKFGLGLYLYQKK